MWLFLRLEVRSHLITVGVWCSISSLASLIKNVSTRVTVAPKCLLSSADISAHVHFIDEFLRAESAVLQWQHIRHQVLNLETDVQAKFLLYSSFRLYSASLNFLISFASSYVLHLFPCAPCCGPLNHYFSFLLPHFSRKLSTAGTFAASVSVLHLNPTLCLSANVFFKCWICWACSGLFDT